MVAMRSIFSRLALGVCLLVGAGALAACSHPTSFFATPRDSRVSPVERERVIVRCEPDDDGPMCEVGIDQRVLAHGRKTPTHGAASENEIYVASSDVELEPPPRLVDGPTVARADVSEVRPYVRDELVRLIDATTGITSGTDDQLGAWLEAGRRYFDVTRFSVRERPTAAAPGSHTGPSAVGSQNARLVRARLEPRLVSKERDPSALSMRHALFHGGEPACLHDSDEICRFQFETVYSPPGLHGPDYTKSLTVIAPADWEVTGMHRPAGTGTPDELEADWRSEPMTSATRVHAPADPWPAGGRFVTELAYRGTDVHWAGLLLGVGPVFEYEHIWPRARVAAEVAAPAWAFYGLVLDAGARAGVLDLSLGPSVALDVFDTRYSTIGVGVPFRLLPDTDVGVRVELTLTRIFGVALGVEAWPSRGASASLVQGYATFLLGL